TNDGASQLDARVRSTRACIERSAARGMLSCKPAHATRSRELARPGSRSSRAPTRRRNARICSRVSIRRELVMSVLAERARGRAPQARSAMETIHAHRACGSKPRVQTLNTNWSLIRGKYDFDLHVLAHYGGFDPIAVYIFSPFDPPARADLDLQPV